MQDISGDLPPPPDVRGVILNGDTPYVISTEENADLCRSTGTRPADDGTAHPIYYFIATQLGMKYSVAEFCALFDFDVADGPMIIGSNVTFHHPLRVETPYAITGEILDVVRKHSRKLGVMDIATYRFSLVSNGDVAAEVTNSWVFPRKVAS